MDNFNGSVIYRVVFPTAIYFVLFNMLYSIGMYANDKMFGGVVSGLYVTSLSALITLVVMIIMYRNANVYAAKPYFEAAKLPREILYIASIVVLGIVLNVIASHIPLIEVSESFAKASDYLGAGSLMAKILANAILTPALEEVVFRGIVYGELEKKLEMGPCMILSAALFGLLHFNVVQMIYAFLVGLWIGFVYEQTHKLWVVYAGHALLNLAIVLIAG